MCRSARNSQSPDLPGPQTMCIGLPFSMTSGGLSGSLESGRNARVDLGDQKKTPKQTGRRSNKQENTQREAPGSSALCLRTHSDSAALLPIDTLHFLTFGYPACTPVCVCQSLYESLWQVVCLNHLYLVLLFAPWNFLYFNDCFRMFLCAEERYCVR